jgi:hypothetical protein
MSALRDTLGNAQWLRDNEEKLRAMLPETWTLATNLDGLRLGFSLKLAGVDWRSEDEFGRVMLFLEKVGIMQRKDYLVRRNPSLVFAK